MAVSYSIIAATFYGNRGAEAMLTTTISQLRSSAPQAIFNIFSYYPAEDGHLVDDPAVKIYDCRPMPLVLKLLPGALLAAIYSLLRLPKLNLFVPKATRALRDSDALYDLAGVAFVDGRTKFLPFNILTLLPAILLKVPVIKLSQAIGPFHRGINRIAARMILPRCSLIFARGRLTLQHLEALGLANVTIKQCSDTAFSQRRGDSLTRENDALVGKSEASMDAVRLGTKGLVGICPSAVLESRTAASDKTHSSLLAEMTKRLLDDGFSVLLFPNATRANAGEALRNNDLAVISRIVAQVGPNPKLVAVDYDLNTDAIKYGLIAKCDVVLGSRFHAMVACLSLAKPIVVVGWSHKYKEVMADFGLEHCTFDYKREGAEQLHAKVLDVFRDRDAIRTLIEGALPAVIASSNAQFQIALSALAGSRVS